MICGAMVKEAIYSLNESMKQLGREVDAEEIADIVGCHAMTTAVGAAASGAITGVGSVIALGIATTSTITMYGRLAKAMGVRLNNGLIRAIASAVVADLAAAFTAILVSTMAISFIPGLGNMTSAAINGITNFGFVYLAGLIFIKLVSKLGVGHIENMSEEEIQHAAKDIRCGINIKAAMKEAKQMYKENKQEEY